MITGHGSLGPSERKPESLSSDEKTALELVLRDFGFEPTDLRATVVHQNPHQSLVRLVAPIEMFLAFGPREPIDSLLGRFADQIQEHLLDSGTVMPPCPGHNHPMKIDDSAYPPRWVCPAGTEFQMFKIGHIHG